MSGKLNLRKLEIRVIEIRERLKDYDNLHLDWCEVRDGFHCDCGLEHMTQELRNLRLLRKNPQMLGN
jgi:hypothetical protein